MRSLTKPPKAKAANQQNNEGNDKKNVKNQSKKVVKTVFNNPFRYKIQALSLQDGGQVIDSLINYAKDIRKEVGIEIKRVQNQKFIGFNSKVAHEKPPLITEHLIYGAQNCLKKIRKNKDLIKIIAFFYDQNKHQLFQQLMCEVLYNRIPYLVLRDSQILRGQLGIKKMLAMGLSDQKFSDLLLKYGSRCLIDIPWLVETNWMPLSNKI